MTYPCNDEEPVIKNKKPSGLETSVQPQSQDTGSHNTTSDGASNDVLHPTLVNMFRHVERLLLCRALHLDGAKLCARAEQIL